MLRSLRARLLLATIPPLLVFGAVALWLVVRSVNDDQRAQNVRQLESNVVVISDTLGIQARAYLQKQGDPPKLRPAFRNLSDASVYYVPNPQGQLDLPAGDLPVLTVVALDWKRLNKGESQLIEFREPSVEGNSLAVARGIFLRKDKKNGAIGAVVLARPLNTLVISPVVLARRLLTAFLVALLVAGVIAAILGWRLTRPLRALASAARQIGSGSYDVVLDRGRTDEIGQVNRAFGDMAEQLKLADEQKRNFLMRVSHELRTPLTAIQGHVQALADGIFDDPDDAAAAYEVIEKESARLERLIRDLLDLARIEARVFALEVEEVDVRRVLGECWRARRESARANAVDLVAEVSREQMIVFGDGDRLLQIVSNLVENAVRWTPPGGSVAIRAGRVKGHARIEVIDGGPGVPIAQRDQIFEPFFSGDGQGAGLGLAISSELATAMGGHLSVKDGPGGRGARFVLDLPLHRQPTRALAHA